MTSVTQGTKQARYAYDDLGQLIREDNIFTNQTNTYTYDLGGNIQSKSEYPYRSSEVLGTPTRVVLYTYGNNSWKDQMTAYNGNPITYDGLGNPLTYDGYTYSWTQINSKRQVAGYLSKGIVK